MALDVGMVAKTINVGSAKVLEAAGVGLAITATLKANLPTRGNSNVARRLTWGPAGTQWWSRPTAIAVDVDADATFIDVPCIDQAGWKLDGLPVDLGGDGLGVPFTWTITVDAKDGAKKIGTADIGPFVVRTTDPDVIDADQLIPLATTAGTTVSVVDSWTALVSAAAASAAAAQTAAEAALGPTSEAVTAVLTDPGSEPYGVVVDLVDQQTAPIQGDVTGLRELSDETFTAGLDARNAGQIEMDGTAAATAVDTRIGTKLGPRYSILGSGTSERVGVGTTDPPNNNYGTKAAATLSTDLAVTVSDTNAGASGANSTQLLSYLPSWLDENRPNVVTLELPINDVNLSSAVAHDTTLANLGKQVAMVRLAGAVPVFVTTPAINAWQYGNTGQQTDSTSALYGTLRADLIKLAASMGVAVADGYGAMRGMVNYLTDGVHMNDAGAAALGQRVVAPTIEGVAVTDISTTLFVDDFSATLDPAWSNVNGFNPAIDAGTLRSASGGDGGQCLRTTGQANHALFADMTWTSGNTVGGIVVRSDGTIGHGYLLALYYITDHYELRLYRLEAGGATLLASDTVAITGLAHTLGLTIGDSGRMLCWLDGKAMLSCADTTYTTGNYAGVRQQDNATLRWDNVRASY